MTNCSTSLTKTSRKNVPVVKTATQQVTPTNNNNKIEISTYTRYPFNSYCTTSLLSNTVIRLSVQSVSHPALSLYCSSITTLVSRASLSGSTYRVSTPPYTYELSNALLRTHYNRISIKNLTTW